jgi:hypothetical protein
VPGKDQKDISVSVRNKIVVMRGGEVNIITERVFGDGT